MAYIGEEQALTEEEVYSGGDYPLLPPMTDVKMQCVETYLVTEKDGTDPYLRVVCIYEIIDGEHSGKRILEGYTLRNGTKDCGVADRIFSQASWAIAGKKVGDNEHLLMIPFVGDIKVQPAKNGYPAKNSISKYKKYSAFGNSQPSAQPQSSGSNPGAGKKPWQR